ncbi:MAG: glycosyltransferase family 4 protein [Anaerolineales bacterium]
MRRILYFSRFYTPHDYRFLSAFVEHGDEVAVMHLENAMGNLEQRPYPPSVKRINWKGGKSRFSYGNFFPLMQDFKKQVQIIQPQVVLAGPIQTCAFLVAASGYPRLVSMSWGYDLFVDAQRDFWQRWVTKFTLKRSAAMLGDCETIRQIAVSYGMSANNIVIFPWGVDLNHFSYKPIEPSSKEDFTFLSTRSWEPIYGVDLIAEAFARIAQQQPKLHLIMLGSGSLSAKLHKIFVDYGVMDRVSFPGQVGYEDLPDYYHRADVYLSASHSDGSSVSLLEAMACGRAAIVSAIGGNREWIEDGKQGWLFPDGDVDSLAEKMLFAFQKRERLTEMGKEARRLVEEKANWKENFPKIYQVIDLFRNGVTRG